MISQRAYINNYVYSNDQFEWKLLEIRGCMHTSAVVDNSIIIELSN